MKGQRGKEEEGMFGERMMHELILMIFLNFYNIT